MVMEPPTSKSSPREGFDERWQALLLTRWNLRYFFTKLSCAISKVTVMLAIADDCVERRHRNSRPE